MALQIYIWATRKDQGAYKCLYLHNWIIWLHTKWCQFPLSDTASQLRAYFQFAH